MKRKPEPFDIHTSHVGSTTLIKQANRHSVVTRILIALIGVLLFSTFSAPFWWLGVGLFLTAILGLIPPTSFAQVSEFLSVPRKLGRVELVPLRILGTVVALALAAGICAWLIDGSWDGTRIDDQDHAVHFAKTAMLRQTLMEHGHPLGWSHKWFAGFPVGYLYPIGAYYWVMATDVLTLGLLSPGQVYSWSLIFFYIFYGFAAFLAARSIFGFWPGILAMCFAMVDPGGGRSGGWLWAMDVGVWPNSLAMAFTLASMSFLRPIIQGKYSAIGGFALFCGLAIITHPLQVLFYPIALLALVFAWVFHVPNKPRMVAVRLGLSTLLATLVAGIWLFPFLDTGKDWSLRGMGTNWDPAFVIGSAIFNMEMVHGLGKGVFLLGSIGTIWGLTQKRLLPATLSFLVLLVVGFMNATFLAEFFALDRLPILAGVQFLRGNIWLRAILCILAGATTCWMVRGVFKKSTWPKWTLGQSVVATVFITLSVPVFFGVLGGLQTYVNDFDRVRTVQGWGSESDRADLTAYLRTLPDPGEQFYRVAFYWGKGSTAPYGISPEFEAPYLKSYYDTPGITYRHVMRSSRVSTMRLLNVRYVIHDKAIPGSQFKKLAQFGKLQVYEFLDYTPDPFTVIGSGEVETIGVDDEELVFRAQPGAKGKLRINVSNFDRWVATIDGERVPIESVTLKGERDTGFMSIPLRPGLIRLEFVRSWLDWASYIAGLLAILVCLLLLLGPKRIVDGIEPRLQPLVDKLSGPFLRHPRSTQAALALGVAIAGGVLVWWAWQPVPTEGREGKVLFDFQDVNQAEVALVSSGGIQTCTKVLDRHVCGPQPWDHVAVHPARMASKSHHHCISARPHPGKTLEVRYEGVALGSRFDGLYGVPFLQRFKKKSQSIEFEVEVDGKVALKETLRRSNHKTPFSFATTPGTADVVFRIRGSQIPFCFHAQTSEP